jgi:DUF4097 and DUF4098 domain-containing protein YvlB
MTSYTATATTALKLCCALALTAAPLAAQHSTESGTAMAEQGSDHDDGTAIDTTVPFATSGGVVDLSIVSGEITVSGWNRPEARIHVSSDDENVPVRFEHGPDRILLDARQGRHWHDDDGDDVEYNLTVPVGTRVLMHSTSGDLHARGTHGEIEARSISGDVEVDDVVHGATLESVSGNVQARGIDGDVRARSVSGDVDLDDVTGDITLSSVSGHGYVTNAHARVVRLETVSGDLSYGGPLDPTGTYDFRAHSGDITLELPADVGALLSMDTFSGDIQTDFPLTIPPAGDNGPPSHHVDTTLGRGGAHVTLSTFSGDIELRRSGRSHSE